MGPLSFTTIPFTKSSPIFVFTLLALSTVSCRQANNDDLWSLFEREILDSISNERAIFYGYQYDGLTPQDSYFLHSKMICLKFRLNPEAGFTEGSVYFNSQTDSIEKYVLRVVQPAWENLNNNSFDKYSDTIYIIHPDKKFTLTYVNNQFCDSVFRPTISRTNIEFIYKMKKSTEDKYSSKQ